MREGRSDWFMPSIADMLFLSLFFKVLSNGSDLLNDGDTGWHIVTGESILRTFKIPFADPYSHTAPGAPWTTHEWLAEVIFGLSHRLMGLNGVVLVSAAVITLTFFFLYLFMLRRRINSLVAVSFTILAAFASSLHWLARPHIFSLPLALAFIVILEMYQREKVNHLKMLPPLMILWVNLHGGYILGLILVSIYAAGNLLLALTTPDKDGEARKSFRALGVIAFVTLLATFVNPHGPAILYFPFHNLGRAYLIDTVAEWLSPDFHKYRLFEVTLLLFVTIFALSRKKIDVFEGIVALLLTHMSLYSIRFIPLFSIAVTPMAATRAGDLLESAVQRRGSMKAVKVIGDILRAVSENVTALETRFNRHLWVYAALAICLMIGLNGGRVRKAQVMEYGHNKTEFPVDALDFALANHISGNVFNNDGWGGYMIYHAYPTYRVFLDGRSDMYGVSLVKEYVKVSTASLGYEDVLDKYGVTWVIYNNDTALCQLLSASGKWRLIYADTIANVFLKDIPENHELIERYGNTSLVFETLARHRASRSIRYIAPLPIDDLKTGTKTLGFRSGRVANAM